MNKSYVSAVTAGALSAGALLLTAAPAGALPAAASVDSPGSVFSLKVSLNTVDCFTSNARYKAKATVKSVPGTKKDKYYMKKEIRWDRSVGSNGYRNLDTWKADSGIFTSKDLPTWTTLADSTKMVSGYLGDNAISIHTKVTLKQVRKGPDKTIWQDDRRVWLRGQDCVSVT